MLRTSILARSCIIIAVLFALLANVPNLARSLNLGWVQNIPILGALQPLALGLDLQGGAHLLLELDEQGLIDNRLDLYSQDLRREISRAGISLEQVTVSANGLRIVVSDPDSLAAAGELVTRTVPGSEIAQSGNSLVVNLTSAQINDELQQALSQSLEIVRRRVDETGTREPNIFRQGRKRLVVQLPGTENPERIKQLLGRTAVLTFQLISEQGEIAFRQGQKLPVGTVVVDSLEQIDGVPVSRDVVDRRIYLSGEHLKDALPSIDQQGLPIVQFTLNTSGSRRFEDLTRKNVGRRLAILLDNKLISSPVIRQAISGGTVIIEGGNMTTEEAQDLSLLMRSGALPVTLNVIEERTVGPGMGADSIKAGILASIVGVLLILAYMIAIYRRFGLFATLVLTLNMLLLLAVITVIGGTLTLPGIAGLVLTIGMMVDANVLIYERIRDEYYQRRGYQVVTAVQNGFRHAISSIVDSNITTLLAALILVGLSSGPIRGFALTLSVGIITSMFTSLLLTRWLVFSWADRMQRRNALLPF